MKRFLILGGLLAAAAGCGGPASSLDGYWQVASGTLTTTCNGTSTTQQLSGVAQFTDGVNGGTVVEPGGSAGCPLTFSANGSVFTASNQSCTVQNGTNTETITITTDTITVSSGTSYTESGSGSFAVSGTTCTFTTSATATKIGKLD